MYPDRSGYLHNIYVLVQQWNSFFYDFSFGYFQLMEVNYDTALFGRYLFQILKRDLQQSMQDWENAQGRVIDIPSTQRLECQTTRYINWNPHSGRYRDVDVRLP